MTGRAEILGMAALHCHLARMDGHSLDKKAMRFANMADYMEHCADCGNSAPLAALTEAVETAVIGRPMHIPGAPFNREDYSWMEQPK